MLKCNEVPVSFLSKGKLLHGIFHQVEGAERALIIVTGGPQTRVGSHRMFVQLARFLAQHNIMVLRFDYRGAGDSEGDTQGFEQTAEDIAAAVQYLNGHYDISNISLWGLCDAASAISLYLKHYTENNITNLNHVILVNPWVKEPSLEAQTYLKFYYWQRFKQLEFWKKLLTGKLKVLNSIRDISIYKKQAKKPSSVSFVDEMLEGLLSFNGQSHLILAEQDLVAQEFLQLRNKNIDWQKVNFTTQSTIKYANHTFSSPNWKMQLFEAVLTTFKKC
ncbi:hydrolase 1, exosortase A system-associated [Thalassotalea ganghwensis]